MFIIQVYIGAYIYYFFMSNKNSAKDLTVYLFLDECVFINLLLENTANKVKTIENRYRLLPENNSNYSKSLGEIQKLIKELYNLPTKVVALESSVRGAIEKIKNGKEFKKYEISMEKIKKLENLLNKNKYKQDGGEYHVRISGIDLYIVKEETEKEYIDSFRLKYKDRESIAKRIFDNGDLEIIKTLVSYADKRNGKRTYILLTLDRRIIKNFSNLLSRMAENEIYILNLNDLYEGLKNLKNSEVKINLKELLYILSFGYLNNSLQNNRKR